MPMLESTGRVLLLTGGMLVALGLLFVLASKAQGVPFIGRLPGDILVQRGNSSFYFPLATSILLSIIATIILNVISRLFSK